jgi:cytochrome c55X
MRDSTQIAKRVGVVAALLLAAGAQVASAADPGPARARALIEMVRQECGSCHGLTLKGGLGPPLVPGALADKDAEGLAFVILQGRPGTAMPPWRNFVSEPEAHWIVRMLNEGLPDEKR